MIPAFLHSLAALLRRLIAAGKAVHCTEVDAVDLEMLVGLFEQHGPVECCDMIPLGQGFTARNVREITPADIALGWLKASRAQWTSMYGPSSEMICTTPTDVAHAAARAELAFMSMFLLPGLGEIRNDDPPAGTIEGARAAWKFIVEHISTWRVDTTQDSDKARAVKALAEKTIGGVIEKYRRELEAMK